MKAFKPLISIGVAIFIWGTGCSKDEEPPHAVERPKVVKPIVKPPSNEIKNPVTDERPEFQPIVEKVPEVMGPVGQVSEAPPQPEQNPLETVTQGKKGETVEEPGIYVVKKGESLSSISGRIEVYGNPLNWPILFRHNMDKLGIGKMDDDLPERIIREDVRLKIVTPEEMKDNLQKRADKFWVINIVSARDAKEVVSPALTLIKGGYLVYITSASVKGQSYQRLRVGFFKDREEANVEAKKIMSLLSTTDFWPTKITKSEHEEFAGY